MGTTSVTHQIPIQRVAQSTAKAAGGMPPGAPDACSTKNNRGPRNRLKFFRKGVTLERIFRIKIQINNKKSFPTI